MAHGLNSVLKRAPGALSSKNDGGGKTGIGSRRIFPPHFKLQVLDSYRNDTDCKGNQRATARKYGIHRRQIQKWLQVENNLRNSVGKSKSGECVANPEQARKCVTELALRTAGLRQRDDLCADACSQSADVRVPAVTPDAYSEMLWPENKDASHQAVQAQAVSVPLDFTTHSRSHASPVAASPVPATCDPAVPMDLSLKTLTSVPPGDNRAPVYRSPSPPTSNSLIRTSPPHVVSPTNIILADVWDLSTKSQKRKYEESLHSPDLVSTTPKPVKLFKPYLDDLHDNSNSSEDFHSKTSETPCCSSYAFSGYGCEQSCCNNNVVCDVKAEYTYTLHELQPRNSVGYYYPVTNSSHCYMYPGSDCDSLYYSYEDPALFQSAHLKQRQSYSLEFKLSAIECYYQDEFCRGNQRAVASKYNIHRRQVQKWLKQEEELRQRNETIKQIHAVS